MGLGYKGDAGHYHSIGENLDSVKNKYGFKNGYFGEPSKSNFNTNKRNIVSDSPIDTAKEFYDKLTYGGIEHKLKNGKGYMTSMLDGSIITWRPISSSSDNSPAVDINITYSIDSAGIKQQKIHFVKG